MSQTSLEALLESAALDAGVRRRLARYGALVLEANRRFNLTGAKSADDLAPHLLDSLTLLPYVREPYVDVGSGAGLPAIPIAIVRGIAPTMIEATAKKTRFLLDTLAVLGLRGDIVAERAETAAHWPALRERFASGTARAVASAPTVAELVLPFIETGGGAILQRGSLPPEELRALEDASMILGASVETQYNLGGGRRIVILRKRASTPSRFPRRAGIPAKRPLCG